MAAPATKTRDFWLKTDQDETFVKVPYTFSPGGADIDSLIKEWAATRWDIDNRQVGKIKMYLVPWPVNSWDHPLPVPPFKQLIELHTKSARDIEQSLADDDLLKAWTSPGSAAGAQDISKMYLEGLVSGARIVVVLPEVAQAAAVGGSSSSASASAAREPPQKKKKWDSASMEKADKCFSLALCKRDMPDDADTLEGFKKIIDRPLPNLYTDSYRDIPDDENVRAVIPIIEDDSSAPMDSWVTYIKSMLRTDDIPFGQHASELSFVTLFRDMFTKAWYRVSQHALEAKYNEVANVAEAGLATSLSDKGYAQKLDHALLLDGVLVCCGEHKVLLNGKEDNPSQQDLIDKFHEVWNGLIMHGLPYLPAYGVCGTAMRFYLIMPDSNNALKVIAVDTSHFDLFDPVDRAKIIRRAMNLAFVFRILKEYSFRLQMPTNRVKRSDFTTCLLQTPRPRGRIEFYLDRVVKTCNTPLPPADMYAAVVAAYTTIEAKIGINTDREHNVVVYSPVCSQVLPLTWKQLIKALQSILRFLIHFHAAGYVHRDIRWPNVLRIGSGQWVLIDFELSAAKDTSSPGSNMIDDQYLPPESRTLLSTYSAAGDIWQVGNLIKCWKEKRSLVLTYSPLHDLFQKMIAEDANERPTAASALDTLQNIV